MQVLRLKPSAAIRKHSTTRPVEVFKKASMRKNKALFLFPGLVSVLQEGKMGQVCAFPGIEVRLSPKSLHY